MFVSRALCYLKVEKFAEAKQDCDAALGLEPTNKKAFYRRALANKGLKVSSPEQTRQQHTHTHTRTHTEHTHTHTFNTFSSKQIWHGMKSSIRIWRALQMK